MTEIVDKPRVLLLSAYDTPSHQYWREGLVEQLPNYHWVIKTLPARYFAWRTRGNSLSWGLGEHPELNNTYDLVVATSMVDVTALKGFRPNLATCPWWVYFHENQFDYPLSKHQNVDINLQLTSIYNALSAAVVSFNSEYNRNTFLEGAKQLLKKMPDAVPQGLLEKITQCANVLPVPLRANIRPIKSIQANQPLKILWNHRWEYDKNPDVFFKALIQLQQTGFPFELNVVGQSFRNSPAIFEHAKEVLNDRIQHWGFLNRDDYQTLLESSDLVISCSWHDFQGLAIQEAIAAGCQAICPERVAYPEYLPQSWMYSAQTDDEIKTLVEQLKKIQQHGSPALVNPVETYHWTELKSRYASIIDSLIGQK